MEPVGPRPHTGWLPVEGATRKGDRLVRYFAEGDPTPFVALASDRPWGQPIGWRRYSRRRAAALGVTP